MAKAVKKQKKPSPFGPIKLRLPFAAADRSFITNVRIDGEVEVGWTPETMVVRGTLKPEAPNPLRIRPIFPGELRFVANKAENIPALADIAVTDGRVDNDYLDKLKLVGLVVIRPTGGEQLEQMKALPRLAAFGPAPGHAIYGPICLDALFLREAVLDSKGLLSSTLYVPNKGKIAPTSPDWERYALHAFLAGDYAPATRASGDKLGSDDADRVAMPAIDILGDRSFSLMIALGTACDAKVGAKLPAAPQSPVPTMLFLRHNRAGLREVFDENGTDEVVRAMLLDGEGSAEWEKALRGRLMGLGFGDVGGEVSLEAVIREFQIAAAGKIVAQGKPGVSREQLARRDYRDLLAVNNEPPYYPGPISGMANLLTLEMIGLWESNGWRSPLLIVVHKSEIIDESSIPVIADVWAREEVRENNYRMFAADLTRIKLGKGLDHAQLELIGYYAIYPAKENPSKSGGPSSLPPSTSRRIALAEVTPMRMIGYEDAELIAALPPAVDGPLTAIVSTFKVIRAVAEQECLGYLDQINGYDNAGLSFGPCHWAMAGAISNPTGGTELGAFAAYLRMLEAQGKADIDVFVRQGMCAIGSGQPGWSSSGGAFYAPLGFIDGCRRARGMERSGPAEMVPSWRNFYRWVAIGRRHPTIGRASWSMAALRLHSFLSAPIKGDDLPIDPRQTPDAVPTIATVFTSELAVATLMRWHVKSPDGVIEGAGKNAKASEYVVAAYKDAAGALAKAKKQTTDIQAWEIELVTQLRKQLAPFRKKRKGLHGDLVWQFKDLENPKWINQSKNPPERINNDFAYGLDPMLRVLSKKGGSFSLASSDFPD